MFVLVAVEKLHAQLQVSKIYTYQDDGFVNNFVRCIFQDSKGFIWIGTAEGVSQYNGYQFVNYSRANGLSNNLVIDITEIGGAVYLSMNEGYIDRIENGRVVPVIKLPKNATGFVHLPGKPAMILTAGDGYYEFQHGTFVKPKQQTDSWYMNTLMPLNDSLLIGKNEAALFVLTKDFVPRIDTLYDHGKPSLTGMIIDNRKQIWVSTTSGFRKVIPDLPHQLLRFEMPDPGFYPRSMDSSRISTLSEGPDGIFWIASAKELVRIDPEGGLRVYSQKEGQPFSFINTVFCDQEKNTWLGTAQGLVKLNSESKLDIITVPTELQSRSLPLIFSILPIQKTGIFFTTYRRFLYHPSTGQFSGFLPEDTVFLNRVVPGSNPLVFYSGRDIGYLDTSREKKEIVLFPPVVRSPLKRVMYSAANHCQDKNGNIFIGLMESITAVSGGKLWVNQTITDWIWSMTVDRQGYLWVATQKNPETGKNYLYRIRYSFENDSLLFHKSDYTQLVNGAVVKSLFTDSRGNIWAGTQEFGVYCLIPMYKNTYAVKKYDIGSGLSSNHIKSIKETGSGDLLLGTQLGVEKLVREKEGYRVFNLSKVYNLFGVVYLMEKGENDLWWCVLDNNKLACFRDLGYEHKPPLPANIISVRLGAVKDSILIHATDKVISLRHNQNFASIVFSAPGYINEKRVLYSYRLLGSGDSSWSIPASVHEVFYASLQPGRYLFQVRTIGWNGKPGDPDRFAFRIRPPFRQTAGFRIGATALVLLLLYGFYRYRIRQLKNLQRVRSRIARDLHDDIGSTLTNISMLTELSQRSREEPDKSGSYLDRIREEIDNSGQALDDIIWSVNSKNDTLAETAARMRRYAAELFDAGDIHYELNLDPQLSGRKIMMEQRRDLYLIFKEALRNIQKHAAASSVLITLKADKEIILLVVQDDGKGFDPDLPTHRNGVANMKERAARWKGRLNLESANGNGTVMRLSMPLSAFTQKGD